MTRAFVFAFCLAACTTPVEKGPVAPSTEAAVVTAGPEVALELRAPAHARWAAATLSAAQPTIDVSVRNASKTEALDVADLRLHLEALRDEVSFRCAESVGPEPGAREPASLGPGATFVFHRTLDCGLPLVGSYAVRVGVSFGRGSWSKPKPVRAFQLRVLAPKDTEPRRVEPIPGLWAAIGASAFHQGDASGGNARIVVMVVNAGPTPLELPRLRLALRVYRVGVPIPCEDEPLELRPPAVLPAGATYREPLAVSCLGLGKPGSYDIAGRLEIGEGSEATATEIGRMRIDITNDPSILAPLR